MLDTLTSSDIVVHLVTSRRAWITVDDSVKEQNKTLSDPELVMQIGEGDAMAETLLYNKFHPGVLLMLQGRVHDRARAEDLAQDTLVIVISRLRDRGIDNPLALGRFIQQTAKYTFIGWVRKAGNQVELRESFDQNEQEQPSAIDIISTERRSAAVRDIIDSLKIQRDREILHRFYVKEQSKPVICEALDLSQDHFDRVINRARNRFKQLVPMELKQDV